MSTKVPSKVIGIQFSTLSPEQIRRASVANITSRDTYINNKPCIGGIFDPRMGVLEPGLICPTDGLDYMQICLCFYKYQKSFHEQLNDDPLQYGESELQQLSKYLQL